MLTEKLLQHVIDISDLPLSTIMQLLEGAQAIIDDQAYLQPRRTTLSDKTVANLFFEPSTRTLISFELAAKRLGATVVNVDLAHSSLMKGETMLDTVQTLSAMGCDIFVIRHPEDQFVSQLARQVGTNVHLINAGTGVRHHPTQALLDALTIVQNKPDFSSLKIAIVGDIAKQNPGLAVPVPPKK